MADKEIVEGMKVKIRPGRPFGGREGVVKAVASTRVTVELLPDKFTYSFLMHDVEVIKEK